MLMDKIDLDAIISKHELWIAGRSGGEQANLSGSDLSMADLDDSDLRGADLSGADLSYTNFEYADLRKANLRYADFSGANLMYASLCNANLTGANMSLANMRWARLDCANMTFANMRLVDLKGAHIGSADFSDAEGIVCAGKNPQGYRIIGVSHGLFWMVYDGYHWFSMDDARAHWKAAGNRDALERLAIIEDGTL